MRVNLGYKFEKLKTVVLHFGDRLLKPKQDYKLMQQLYFYYIHLFMIISKIVVTSF